MVASDETLPPGDPAPELLEGRLWVDGCFDFFHHGARFILPLTVFVILRHCILKSYP